MVQPGGPTEVCNVWDWADRKRLRWQAESIRFDFQSLSKNFTLKKNLPTAYWHHSSIHALPQILFSKEDLLEKKIFAG
jgi:hypothetical protein